MSWIAENWHKLGIIFLFIMHFWDKFEKIANFVNGFLLKRKQQVEQEMNKQDKLKLLLELLDAAKEKGFNESTFSLMTHGKYPNRKSLKQDSIRVKKLLEQVRKEFNI